MLGRPHEVRGVVQQGDQRGRELGYPTANVAVSDELQLPADGIYAGWYVRPDGTQLPAAVSLGRRPTFYESQPFSLLEAHVLDFSGDLYGQRLVVELWRRLRDERAFADEAELIAQIGRDVEAARAAEPPVKSL
jgi:riboflavin kinase/FMN adenylyltransferase